MLTLENLSLLLIVAALAVWVWHGHGRRERALHLAKQHCAKIGVELLDGNVAFERYGWRADGRGNKRFARLYHFEFTVTGEQRLSGRITLFGNHLGAIALDPHPFASHDEPEASAKIINLEQWRREHPRPDHPPQQHNDQR